MGQVNSNYHYMVRGFTFGTDIKGHLRLTSIRFTTLKLTLRVFRVPAFTLDRKIAVRKQSAGVFIIFLYF
jgi:hypothetical protein